MKLEDIGFYTLSDERADTASASSRLMRCELLLGSKCNFACPYCRHAGGDDISFRDAIEVIDAWGRDHLFAIRFSGGEPTLHPDLPVFVAKARLMGVERIAVSTNGSADPFVYRHLLGCGVNDFSISLDACCAADGDLMAGGVKGAWEVVVENIKMISSMCYVTVGVVLTNENAGSVNSIIKMASSLGVADIRIIPAAQEGNMVEGIDIDKDILDRHPILRHRVANISADIPTRGLSDGDCRKCGLMLDDMAVDSSCMHYPCIIYLREGGKPIGRVGPRMREDRMRWYEKHDSLNDPICRSQCLEFCREYNARFAMHNPVSTGSPPVHVV
jgi:MoaA/NifB/PqqE/SkfB family radical SAM enzyme